MKKSFDSCHVFDSQTGLTSPESAEELAFPADLAAGA